MALGIHIQVSPGGTLALLHRVADSVSRVESFTARKVAREALGLVRDRTAKGLDAREKPFQEYSASHRKARARLGLGGTPDLRLSGRMLSGLRAHVRGRGNQRHAALRFNSARDTRVAGYHNEGRGKNPVREFLGFYKGTRSHRALVKTAKRAVREQIREAILRRR